MKAAWMAALLATLTTSGVVSANDDAGWSARVDALLLTPKVQGQGFRNIFVEVPDATEFLGQFDNGLEGGVRFVIAKENCDGFGVRFRYFDFDNDVGYDGIWDGGTPIVIDGESFVDVHAIDIEATQRGTFRSWDLQVSGGLRQGSVEIGQEGGLFPGVGTFYALRSGVEFDGVGPTFAVGADRRLGGSNLSLVGRARTSLLFGDIDVLPTFGGGSQVAFSIVDEFVQVWEFQFGLNYEKRISRGREILVGVFWEAQRWDSDSNALGDLALHGLSIQSGINF